MKCFLKKLFLFLAIKTSLFRCTYVLSGGSVKCFGLLFSKNDNLEVNCKRLIYAIYNMYYRYIDSLEMSWLITHHWQSNSYSYNDLYRGVFSRVKCPGSSGPYWALLLYMSYGCSAPICPWHPKYSLYKKTSLACKVSTCISIWRQTNKEFQTNNNSTLSQPSQNNNS